MDKFYLICSIVICLSRTFLFGEAFHAPVQPRIIGGTPARAGQFPFAVAIYKTTSLGQYFCGGALLNNEWVLTAGHCVEDGLDFTLVAGSNTLASDDKNRVIVYANTSFLHPYYNSLTLENDVGLIKLSEKITFSDYISSIFLPSTDLQPDAKVVSIGWGQTDDYNPGPVDHLNYVSVTTVSDTRCTNVFQGKIGENMFCVEGLFNEGTCIGDLGTPLVRYVLNERHAEHVGISTFISTNGCESTDPSGYTKTFGYVEWIRNVTSI